MDFIYLNFYSFGSTLAGLFCLYIAIFFITIKERSPAALILGGAGISAALFHFAYAVGFMTVEVWGVYHRWLVIPTALMTFSHLVLVFFYFPSPKYERFGLSLYSILLSVIGIIAVYYIAISYHSVGIFVRGNHYRDFETYSFYKYYSIIVLVYNTVFVAAGIWRAFSERGRERRAVIYMLLAFCMISVIPALTNALNRNGSISRIVYQQAVDLSFVIGFFLLLVIYLNISKEKTTVLSRIIGISMATFFLVFQIVAYLILNEYEAQYDKIRFQEAKLIVKNKEQPADLKYVLAYGTIPGESVRDTEVAQNTIPKIQNGNKEAKLFLLRSALSDMKNASGKERWKKAEFLFSGFETDQNEFLSYREGLREFLLSREEKSISDSEMSGFFGDINGFVTIAGNKLVQLPDKRNESAVLAILNSGKPGLSAMMKIAGGKYSEARRKGVSSEKLSVLLSESLCPAYFEGQRIYRGMNDRDRTGTSSPEYFVSYFIQDETTQTVYEVGFDYKVYRGYIHSPSSILAVCLISIMFVVIVGFKYFFRYALIRPMNDVVAGLQAIHSGNLQYRLVPSVEDEIGFIARSFNHMADSILVARDNLEKYAQDLENKVNERTKELQHSLTEVKDLKEQQDGDYFLMSLLLKPLGVNRAAQENVKVEFFTEQKKKFKFRNYDSEIGGDISTSKRIFLRGKKYTVFLNADAMGKSMQGAGGALVLGAVFEAILERTNLIESVRNHSPEKWLKDAFLELHKVFESFDGSMLVSLVLGLVDDEVGILYYVNAEHPWTVLYRNGVASFIESEMTFRKLGTGGINGHIYVKTLQLEPGDVIIAGSDGRDDFMLLGKDDKKLNDDHTKFLEFVHQGTGSLRKIYESITSNGRLTDDLSLVRIAFKEENVNVPEANPNRDFLKNTELAGMFRQAKRIAQTENFGEAIPIFQKLESLHNRVPLIKKYLTLLHLRKGLYREAAHYAEDYLNLDPLDNEMLYFISYTLKKCREFERAADFGERLRLRNPSHFKNLLNLSGIYMALNDPNKAEAIANDAFSIDPENLKVNSFLETLKRRRD
ncbi:HAMP domain-containing protein [Leptospira fletcheri]|uniref:HAMP domain-containing protein n=1 Tax=Leptospira fletcheri TaxID=2484981 RepID=A0A4R9GBL8_9LEPT|nr:SpoIIE family protein phosphatase [Leptospira fletcheri]TGK08765.1 HAMP domain-containing protein [Leptospira fletcheri]